MIPNVFHIRIKPILLLLLSCFTSVKLKNADGGPSYLIDSIYRHGNDNIIVVRLVDHIGKQFKISVAELVTKRKDLLAEFSVEDIIKIVSYATSAADPEIIEHHNSTYRFYTLIAMLFCSALIVSNICSSKLISLFGITMTGGTVSYSITYILGTTITEVYGYKRSRQVIWGSIFSSLLFTAMLQLCISFKPSVVWHGQNEFSHVLGAIPIVVLASLVSYFCGEIINSFFIAKLKLFHSGKKMWRRFLYASITGIAVDSFIFVAIAYHHLLGYEAMLWLTLRIYLLKGVVEFFSIPVNCFITNFIKGLETTDIYDEKTRFTPFSLDVLYPAVCNRYLNIAISNSNLERVAIKRA